MEIILKDKNGVILHTNKKYCKEDISVKVDDSLILDTSDATATAEDIAKGKTAYVNSEKVVGELVPGDAELDVKIDLASRVNGNSIYNLTAQKLLKKVNFTNVDLSNTTTLKSMFYNCYNLEEVVGLDLSNSNITIMESFVEGTDELTKVEVYNTGNVQNWKKTFYEARVLENLPLLDMSSAYDITNLVVSCPELKNVGGFKDLGKGYVQTSEFNTPYALILSSCTLLTHESLMNIINNLYDLNLTYNVANGGTLYTQSLVLGSTNKAKLTADEIAIAINKGWTVV